MNDAMREIILGPEGQSYVDKCLASGRSLASFLRRRGDFGRGRVVTRIPPEVPDEGATRFDMAILPPPLLQPHGRPVAKDRSTLRVVPKPDVLASLVPIMSRHLKEKGHLCIFEDDLASPSDPWLASLQSGVLAHENEVYHFLLHTDWSDLQKIETIMGRSFGVVLIGAMTSLSPGLDLSHGAKSIESDALRVLAERAKAVVVGAYDGQGYLLWMEAERET